MAEPAIEILELNKIYPGNIQAVKDISLSVKKGEFFAFLGPNGAGKSTTIKILTTLIKPTSGRINIAGYDILHRPDQIRMRIGVALQTTAIDPGLTGREIIVLQGRLFGLTKAEAGQRAKELLELVSLSEDADRPCGKYSGGMKRRLDLALTLVHRPEILFLDEPTTGLDPASRRDLWLEIQKLNKEYGTTVFLTTQYLEEADKMADRVCIIKNGIIAASGTPRELKRSVAPDRVFFAFASVEEKEKAKAVLAGITFNIDGRQTGLNVYVENSREYLPVMIKKMSDSQLFPWDIAISSPTLDDVFLQVNRSPSIFPGALRGCSA